MSVRAGNSHWFAVLLTMALTAAPAVADAACAELQVLDTQGGRRTILGLDTQVHYRVRGPIAQVQVHQRFRNNGSGWVEGEYLLPLPDGAAVYGLRMRVGERVIVGEIQEKQAAHKTFARARASARRASLVEAASGNLFRTALTNVARDETVDVEVDYWQRLDYRDGEFSLSFPLTYTPRYHMSSGAQPGAADPGITGGQVFARSSSEPPLRTSIEVDLDAGIGLAHVYSPSHEIVTQPRGRSWQVRLARPSVNPDRDFVLHWVPQAHAQPNVAVFRQSVDDAHYAMLMMLPPQQLERTLPRELILVIDTSGSMQGTSIRQARAALDLALSHLGLNDRFNIIEFNSSMTRLHPHAVRATAQAVVEAREWVARLQAGGGTEMYPALEAALGGRAPPGYLRQIVFVTDGAVDNPGGLLELIDQQRGDSRLFPVGIGSAPNRQFLDDAAHHGRGSETLIRDLHQVRAAMQRLLARLDHPALRDIQVQWPNQAEAYPRTMPDLYLGEPLLVVARMRGSRGRVLVSGAMADRHWSDPVDLDQAQQAAGLDQLWAQSRIAELEEKLAQGGDLKTLKPQIVHAALSAHLVSRFTSLVAVDRTPRRDSSEPLEHSRIPNVLPHGEVFAQTATPARAQWLAGALLALLALACMRLAGPPA